MGRNVAGTGETRERVRSLVLQGWTDAQIAEHLACTPENVINHRTQLGLPANAPKVKPHDALRHALEETCPGIEYMAGRKYDREVAAHFGITHNDVVRYRRARGIPAAGRRAKSSEQVERDILARYPGIELRLGQVPDRVVGEEYGITQSAVSRLRRQLGIEKAPVVRQHGTRPENVEALVQALREHGEASTGQLAAATGLSQAGVGRMLRRGAEEGLVERVGRGARTRWRLVAS